MSIASLLILSTTLISLTQSLLNCVAPFTECKINGVPGETIYQSQLVSLGDVICNQANQCTGVSIVTLANRFNIDCNNDNSCINSKIETGLPLVTIPSTSIPGLPTTNVARISGRINCDGVGSCRNSKIIFSGNYPGGVVLSALGLNALQNTEIVCDLENGQQCRFICSSEVDSCTQASITCNSCNCICAGKYCPNPSQIIQGMGCPRDIPKNKRFPEIECTPDVPPPDECLDAPFIKEDDNGELKCIETADCCSCASVDCGPECKSVLCDGERSCIGVPINIDGIIGGASLHCGLLKACNLAAIAGNNVRSIDCVGVESCQRATFDINAQYGTGLSPLLMQCGGVRSCQFTKMIIRNGGMLNCGGNDACDNSEIQIDGALSGLTLDCSGNGACDNSIFKLTNVFEWMCTGNFACRNTVLDFDCLLPQGCELKCGGTQACREGKFNIKNINNIDCRGNQAGCFLANFVFTCIDEGCPIRCNNQDACRRSNMQLTNTNGLLCTGSFACAAAVITVTNNIGMQLTCKGQSACRDAKIGTLNNLNGIECSSWRACRDSVIKAGCNNIDGCGLRCSGVEACLNADITSTNVRNIDCDEDRACDLVKLKVTPLNYLFKINCLSPLTCNSGNFNVMIGSTTVDKIEGVSCMDTESCFHTKFTFDGRILSTPLIVNKIYCNGIKSCVGAIFRFINAKILDTQFMCTVGACDANINVICESKNGTVLPREACITPTSITV